MKHIVFCWELGEDLGHLAQVSKSITQLTASNFRVTFIVRSLEHTNVFYKRDHVTFLQAPISMAYFSQKIIAQCLSDIMLTAGFHSPEALLPLVKAWRALFDLLRPDMFVFDHSPTAMIAARHFNTPKISLSNPFLTPPPGSPPINFRRWEQENPKHMARSESHVVGVINSVCKDLSIDTIEHLSDIYAVNKVVFATFKELDFFRDIRDASVTYIGPMPTTDTSSKSATWPSIYTQNIFVYLKWGKKGVEALMESLLRTPVNIICYLADAPEATLERFRTEKSIVSNEPWNLENILKDANGVVSHGGRGLVGQTLLAGLPMVVRPSQVEQVNTLIKLEPLGLARGIKNDFSPEEMDSVLQFTFIDNNLDANVKRFQKKYAYFNQRYAVESMLDIIDEELKQ